MMDRPETRYVPVGDADLAYQVVGEGPIDLLYFIGMGHVDVRWDHPRSFELISRLATFSRLILFDRRGTGASDGVPRTAIPTWEEWTDDVRAVLDAANSDRAAIFAALDAGPVGALFAAMQPERVSALILGNTSARFTEAPDYPIGVSSEVVDTLVEVIATQWGTPDFVRTVMPSLAGDEEYLRFNAQWFRAAATPRTAAAQYRYMFESVDVRAALPLIQVPTLVLHNRGNPFVPLAHGRYLAEHIPGARLIELPCDGASWGPNEEPAVAEDVTEFLTGQRPGVEIERVLTTVLFTDIVGSTERLASVGDQRWRSVLDAHDRAVREQIRRFRGREIKTTGDGFLVSFDGPARAIRCARAINEALKPLGIEVRAGLHTGECEVRGEDLAGLAVHIASRVGSLAGPGEIVVTGTVKDLVAGSGIEFDDRGVRELKGIPDEWRLLAVKWT